MNLSEDIRWNEQAQLSMSYDSRFEKGVVARYHDPISLERFAPQHEIKPPLAAKSAPTKGKKCRVNEDDADMFSFAPTD